MSVSCAAYHSGSEGQLIIAFQRISGRALPHYADVFELQSSAVTRENPLPSRNAHATIASAAAIAAIDRQTLARSHFVRPFDIHQLHRSLQSLHRGSPYKRRTTPLRLAVGPLAVFLFLDLRVFEADFRLAGRSPKRKLGFCGWFFSVVDRYHRRRHRPRIFLASGVASTTRRRRIRSLPFLLENHRASLSRGTSRHRY